MTGCRYRPAVGGCWDHVPRKEPAGESQAPSHRSEREPAVSGQMCKTQQARRQSSRDGRRVGANGGRVGVRWGPGMERGGQGTLEAVRPPYDVTGMGGTGQAQRADVGGGWDAGEAAPVLPLTWSCSKHEVCLDDHQNKGQEQLKVSNRHVEKHGAPKHVRTTRLRELSWTCGQDAPHSSQRCQGRGSPQPMHLLAGPPWNRGHSFLLY